MDRDRAEPEVDGVPGERAREYVEYHSQFAAPSTYVYEFVWDVTEEAVGPFCTDVDGNVFLDFTSHVASAPLGYNNPILRERIEDLDLPDPTKIAGQDFYSSGGWPPDDPAFPGPAQLMDRLTDLTSQYGLDTVFLSNSGAEAVENAIKIGYDHRTEATRGITFQGAFHGRTLGALSLNRSKAVQRRGFPEISGVTDVPYCDDEACTRATCSCGFFPTADRSRLGAKLHPKNGHLDPADVAYIIMEPIQGEGGYRFPSDAFMTEIADLVDTYDIPLIVDEIQSGLGRTGEFWASDHYPIEPDVVTAAKGLRVGATISTDEVFPEETGRLSSTWGAGDVLATLQGAITIDVIQEEGLLANAVTRGTQLKELLRDLDTPLIEDVRGKGLLVAFDVDTRSRREALVRAALEEGLLVLGCGVRTVRLLPPLDVREREVTIAVDRLATALDSDRVQHPRHTDTHTEDAA